MNNEDYITYKSIEDLLYLTASSSAYALAKKHHGDALELLTSKGLTTMEAVKELGYTDLINYMSKKLMKTIHQQMKLHDKKLTRLSPGYKTPKWKGAPIYVR